MSNQNSPLSMADVASTNENSAPVISKLDPMTMPLQGLHVIEASAGTGKTWTLAALYVRLVLGHGRQGGGLLPPQILVMTFTEAATAELRGRIRTRLSQAARFFKGGEHEAEYADDFLRTLRGKIASDQWPECAYRLDMAAQWMDDAAIYTIHGWSARMLKQHAFDSASLFQQTRVEDSKQLKLIAAQDYWRKWFYPVPASELEAIKPVGGNPSELLEKIQKHWAIADKSPQPIHVEGETPDVLLRRHKQWQDDLMALEGPPRSAWTVDIVNLAKEAATNKLIKGYRADWLENWLAQMSVWALGEPVELKILERFSVTTLVDKGWSNAGEHAAFEQIDALCAHIRKKPEIEDGLLTHAADEIGLAYQNAKTKLAQFDFSDLLQHLYRGLQAPDGRLAAAIRQQYPVALVDEFQDTDPWQYGSLSKIYAEPDSLDTGLIMIGDPKQAIYSFRGADLDTYLVARNQSQAIHTLSGNFRSTEGVVAAVNHVFSRFENPFGDVPFEPVVACNKDIHPLQVGGSQHPAMTVWHLVNDVAPTKDQFMRQMAELFASQMVKLLNQGAANPGEMAVLVRSGTEARAIRGALSARGVRSVYLSERDSVFATSEASDLWRILRAVASPRQNQLVKAAMVTRLWGLNLQDMEALFHDEVAWDNLVEQFHEWQRIWQRQGFLPMLHHLLHDQSIPARLINQVDADNYDGERRLTNLLHLGDLLQTASLNLQGEGALIHYLEEQLQNPAASGEVSELRLESDANLVQVITMHKAKGLQYPLVFLPFVSNFRAEGKDSGKDDSLRLAEDIRLLYVALTRAEKALWVGISQLKGDVDGKTPQVKSAISKLLQRKTPDDLSEQLKGWGECADIVVAVAPEPDLTRYAPEFQEKCWRSVLEPERLLVSRWWTASFSALTQDIKQQTARVTTPNSDRDERIEDARMDNVVTGLDAVEEVTQAEMSVLTFNNFPAGSVYGTLLHDLLEWQAQRGWPVSQLHPAAVIATEWTSVLARKSQRLKLDESQSTQLDAWIQKIASASLMLPDLGMASSPLNLGMLNRAKAWPEMAFTLPVHKLEAVHLDTLIQQYVLKGQSREALQPRQMEGLLTGFMDMVVEHEGRYFVLDYKSNKLPAYDKAQLQQAVLSHRYDVQYALYLLALHRLLKSRLPDYDYDQHVGGAMYLFLRGIDQPGNGLYFEHPPRELIEAMDQAFSANFDECVGA